MNESNIELATNYLSWGLSIVPVKHYTKVPSNEWKAYQSRRATQSEVQEWFKDIMQGIGVVCGSVSGNLVCFDFDAPGSYEHFLKLHPWAELMPTAESARGKHVFFRSPDPVNSSAFYLEGFEGKAGDLIAERKFVVLPPTHHPSGSRRKWIVPLEEDIPVFFLSDFDLAKPPATSSTFEQGDRHDSLLKHSVQLAKDGVSAHDLPAAVRLANQKLCKPPLPVSEVDGIIQFVLANCIIISPPHTPPTDDDQSFQDNSSFIIIPPLSRKGTDDWSAAK